MLYTKKIATINSVHNTMNTYDITIQFVRMHFQALPCYCVQNIFIPCPFWVNNFHLNYHLSLKQTSKIVKQGLVLMNILIISLYLINLQ